MLNETLPGGVYLAADGTYHDANGNPVDKATLAAFHKRQAEQQQAIEEQERQRKLTSPDAMQVLSELVKQPATAAQPADPKDAK